MSDESMAGGDAAPTATRPPAAATHPLGNPAPAAASRQVPTATEAVQNILDLDALLSSAQVHRAEKTATIYLRSDLEGDFDRLEAELELLTDSTGKPYPVPEGVLEDVHRTAQQVATEIQAVIAEYGASAQWVRFRQRPADEWQEFLDRHKGSDEGTRPPEFWNDLIAFAAVGPAMSVVQVAQLRTKLGAPQMTVLGNAAWNVNAQSGVSIPKSLLSSHVLKQASRGMS